MVAETPVLAPIVTDRLRLRGTEERDAVALAGLMSEAVSRRLASWPVPYTPVMALDRIHGVQMAAAERRSLPLVVERRADGAVMGWVSISRTPADWTTALLTYWLGEAYQRQGYMTEGMPPVVRSAFALMDIDRLRAAVQADNEPSLAVIRRLGLAPIGDGRIWCPARGRDEPCLWFELPRDRVRAALPVGADAAL
jgi:ribosomal-protein-alanine N-acetyltransferase